MAIASPEVDAEFVHEVIATVPEGIVSVDEEGTILLANSRVTELLGYTPEELIDGPIERLAPTDDGDAPLLETIHRLADGESEVPDGEAAGLRLGHEDGHEVPVALAAEETDLEDRRFFVASIRDASDGREADGALAEVETRFRKTFEHATDPLLIVDPHADAIEECNDAACELLGYDREEMLACGPSDLHPHEMETFREFVDEVVEDGESSTEELGCYTAGGRVVPTEVAGTVLELDGRRHLLARLRDITERRDEEREHRETKELFRKAFEHSNDAIFVFDPQADEFRDVNPRACELLGYEREELLAMGPSDAHPHELESFREFVEAVVREGGGWTDELSCFTRDEEILPAEISMSRIDLDGVPHVLASVRDVEERRAYETGLEALNEASRELLAADSEEAIAEITVESVPGEIETVENRIRLAEVLAIWSYDAEGERLVPLADTEAGSAPDTSPTDPDAGTIAPIPDGSTVMEVFREGESRVLEAPRELEPRAHPGSSHGAVLFAPIGDHGVLGIESRTVEEISPVVEDLTTTLCQHLTAAFDRLEREREVRRRSTAIEAAIDGMAILDETGELRYANRSYVSIHGYDAPDDLIGEPLVRLYDETERFELDVLPTVWDEGRWRGETVGERADGTTFPAEVSLAALEDGGSVCVVRDVTERKEYEEQLRTLNAANGELSRAETADEVARTGLRAVERILGFEVGCVRFFDDEANAFDPVVTTDAADDLVSSTPAFDLESTLAGRAYRTGETMRNESDEDDPFVDTPGLASLHLPLGDHGVLTIFARDAEGFEERELALAEALSASVRSALDRAVREEALRTNERELRERHEQLDTLYRITALVQEIGDHLVEAGTRAELERTVCDRVAASELYRSAWIGGSDVTADRVDVRVGAEVEEAYLDALDELPVALLGDGTVERALETGEIQVVRRYESREWETQPDVDEHERRVEATAAVPLAYGERVFGVLVVNGAREDVFGETALAGFESLGRLVGFALTALRDRELLVSDAVVELELEVSDPDVFYLRLTDDLDCRCRLDRSVPVEEGTFLHYHVVDGAEPEAVLELADASERIEEARVVSERDDGFVLETVTPRSTLQLALEVGARVRSATAEGGVAELTLEAPRSADVREVVGRFEEAFASVDLLAKRERERAVETSTGFREHVAGRLTEKQRSALEAAYASGYYDWPRETTAQELAESMGISSSTLHQHLRHAVRGLAAAFFDESRQETATQ